VGRVRRGGERGARRGRGGLAHRATTSLFMSHCTPAVLGHSPGGLDNARQNVDCRQGTGTPQGHGAWAQHRGTGHGHTAGTRGMGTPQAHGSLAQPGGHGVRSVGHTKGADGRSTSL